MLRQMPGALLALAILLPPVSAPAEPALGSHAVRVRARYRHSREAPEPLEPGRVEAYTIDLWATCNVFKAGHRIRLYVSSSNFPRFDRNPNTGEPLEKATRAVPAAQAVYHDAKRPSALVLPVIPR